MIFARGGLPNVSLSGIHPRVRFLLLISVLLLLAAAGLQAQQQEQGLSQRLNRSNKDLMGLAYDTRQRAPLATTP